MAEKLRGDEACSRLGRLFYELASNKLKILLETKHLYQRVSIDPREAADALKAQMYPAERPVLDVYANERLARQRLTPSSVRLFTAERMFEERSEVPTLIIGNVKLFCCTCEEREIFSPLWYRDLDDELQKPTRIPVLEIEESPNSIVVQLFCLTYRCQRCSGEPEAFLVRREGWHLSVHGRSPMEHIEVPNHIPKSERPFFRDAMVAMHGGKTLAALFYLRTFIEQFARRQTGKGETRATGDQILEEYSKMLPAEHRDHLPSLKHWYDKLSEALHSARSDEALFEEAVGEIDRHFDIRRVFRIPETATSEN